MTAEIVRPDKKDYSRDWDGLLAMNAEFETYIDHLEQSNKEEVSLHFIEGMKKAKELLSIGGSADHYQMELDSIIKNTIKSK